MEVSAETALKTMILACWRCGGFKARDLENYKMEFLSIYGYQKLKDILRLEEIGLLYIQAQKGPESKQFKDTLINTLKAVISHILFSIHFFPFIFFFPSYFIFYTFFSVHFNRSFKKSTKKGKKYKKY